MPYALHRRQPVPQQFAQTLRTKTLPAPTRGIVESENESYMLPGGALVHDNWAPTMRGVKLRGGFEPHCDLHYGEALDWQNSHHYVPLDVARDAGDGSFWTAQLIHDSPASGSFAQFRALNPNHWRSADLRQPVISAFEYQSGNQQRMYAGQENKLFDATDPIPVLIKSGQTSGNYAAAQMSNMAGSDLGTNWMVACNETGDPVLRFNGTSWAVLGSAPPPALASDGVTNIVGDPTKPAIPANIKNGLGLSYVWKYRNRLFFIGAGSMNAYYLPLDAVGGLLQVIPLAGAASKGGKLLFGATWSLDAGDGIDDKCVFVTDQGEVLIFTGGNPGDINNWRQEGRYAISPPLGMNAYLQIGGDLLILTVDGIIPLSQAITKDAGQMELALLTRTIKRMWRNEVADRRQYPWTAKKWDEYGAIFVTLPGGSPGDRRCLLANNVTGAWGRFVNNYDAMCFMRLRADMFFGTQDGFIMKMETTGYDNGKPYIATLVCGWEMFGAPSNTFVWHQARAAFKSNSGEPFLPQITATVDYEIKVPTPPPAGADPGPQDVWDQGLWGPGNPPNWPNPGDPGDPQGPPTPEARARWAQWDQPAVIVIPIRNTLWQSIGATGYAHAPIVQITIAQSVRPQVELISIAATYEPAGVNV